MSGWGMFVKAGVPGLCRGWLVAAMLRILNQAILMLSAPSSAPNLFYAMSTYRLFD